MSHARNGGHAELGPRVVLGVAASLAIFVGCAGASVDAEAPSLEVGTGSWRFEPIEDGQPVSLVRGAQGGWHVWVSARVRGMNEDTPVLTIETQPADERRPPQRMESLAHLERAAADGTRATIGWAAIIDDPECLVGELMRLRVEVTAPDGTRAWDERYVEIDGGDYPPGECL